MAHEFFDELREANCALPTKIPLPPLFDFNEAELQFFGVNKDKLLSKDSNDEAGAAAYDNKASTSEALPEDIVSTDPILLDTD